jgi:hypothetical protein
MAIYLTPQGERTDAGKQHLVEQFVNEHISILYCDTAEDRRLLEIAASVFPGNEGVIRVARGFWSCFKVFGSCYSVSCSGTCAIQEGAVTPKFAYCKCSTDPEP